MSRRKRDLPSAQFRIDSSCVSCCQDHFKVSNIWFLKPNLPNWLKQRTLSSIREHWGPPFQLIVIHFGANALMTIMGLHKDVIQSRNGLRCKTCCWCDESPEETLPHRNYIFCRKNKSKSLFTLVHCKIFVLRTNSIIWVPVGSERSKHDWSVRNKPDTEVKEEKL